MTKGTNTPETNTPETKAQKFARLAVSRTEKALTAIALLRGLSSKGNYEYTDEQVAKIGAALEAEVIRTMDAFKGKGPVEAGFTL